MRNSDHLKDKVVEVIEQVDLPVDPQYIAVKLGVSWSTARHLLMQLVIEGRVKAEKTTKGWVYKLAHAHQANSGREEP